MRATFTSIAMDQNFTRYAFTDSVKAVQSAEGSRKAYARAECSGDRYRLGHDETLFIENRDSFYLSSIGENDWPYVQYRGGPRGFLKVLNPETLAMPDFSGNRQYISTGNINAIGKVMLFLIDYPTRQRLKIWATADVLQLEHYPELAEELKLPDYRARVERLLRFRIQAFDWNCQQHITPRFTIEEINALDL